MYSPHSEDTLRRFHDSFDSCQSSEGFLDLFYDRLLGHSAEVAALFDGVDMARVKRMLRQGLVLTMVASEGSKHSREYLAALGDKHREAGVGVQHYELWLDTLVSVVAELDSHFDDQVGQAWRDVLGLGIQLMKERYPSPGGAAPR